MPAAPDSSAQRHVMHLKQITLKNFRCFDSLTVELHPKLTVLVADNAIGKTSVLDGIAKGLAVWNIYLDSAEQRLPQFPLDDDDLRVTPAINNRGREVAKLADAAYLALTMEHDHTPLAWDLVHKLNDEILVPREHGDSQLKLHASILRDAIHNGDDEIPVPVFAYYDIHRGHVTVPDRIRETKIDYSRRLAALADALTPTLRDFREIISWFKEASLDELQWEKDHAEGQLAPGESNDRYNGPLPHVRAAFETVLGDQVSNPRIDRITKKFTVDFRADDGTVTPLRFDQLSQGYASMMALVLDLAQRLAVANPRFDASTHHDHTHGVDDFINPLAAPAVVLIDEVDLHLHPTWQQRVLGDLMRAFPGTQFIVTTHSPQVLTTVRKEHIRVLARDTMPYPHEGQWHAKIPEQSPLAQESTEALANIMGTHPRPPLPLLADLHAYEQLARSGQATSEDARVVLDRLTAAGFEFNQADLNLFAFLAAQKAKQKG
jgi:predicted ATP-binding protein involved in virulence